MASCFIAYVVAFYYNIIIGWSVFFLVSSLTETLPWTSCGNEWNSDHCWQVEWSQNDTSNNVTYNANTSVSSTVEFFEYDNFIFVFVSLFVVVVVLVVVVGGGG